MSVTDLSGDRVVQPGQYSVWVGGMQPVAGQAPSANFTVQTGTGQPVLVSASCPNVPRACYGC
jgi:hypothetical protein